MPILIDGLYSHLAAAEELHPLNDLQIQRFDQAVQALQAAGLRPRVMFYAHGGLVSEKGAANAAARWIPALYENHIFPVFLMWETDLFKTLENIAKELILGEPRRTAGLQRWWNERIEKLQKEIAEEHGYELIDHELVLFVRKRRA